MTTLTTSAWVRRFHPADDAATRLICFPHAGGSATYFHPVSRTLSPDVDVLAIQYPGRQDCRFEACVEDLFEMADLVIEALHPWLDRPVSLFGHSMGATIAYEVARRLEAGGHAPLGLFASGRRAPSRHRDERVHRADDDGIVAELLRLDGTDAQVLHDPDLRRMILPAVRADYRAAETYRCVPGSTVGCPVIALVGDADPHVTVDEASGWRDHTTGPFDLKVFPGEHFYLNDHAPAVMKTITDHISEPIAKPITEPIT
ncbi:thioesterase II family protein [Actinomadura rudentiformis]|uniref:Thioesterase n=1 Tax=Actinomadura rudentiformis TaxID=359158 RepID=A0A6H9YZY6_9ACTN|nr:alpha/beta fold hydrolase [Actinomadura rudentiformis]KAB2346153.1 thioesterase [Actinomadura rudentiformis]